MQHQSVFTLWSEPNSALNLIEAVQGRSRACDFAKGRIERVGIGSGELRTVQQIDRVHANFKGGSFLDSKVAPEVGIPLVAPLGPYAGNVDGEYPRLVCRGSICRVLLDRGAGVEPLIQGLDALGQRWSDGCQVAVIEVVAPAKVGALLEVIGQSHLPVADHVAENSALQECPAVSEGDLIDTGCVQAV